MELSKFGLMKPARLTSVLGLTLDGTRLDGVVLRRNNGSFQVQNTFSVSLSLDPLTNAPELVGREIRNHLDALEVRERNCVVGLPLKWALTTHIELPELPEPDVASFLQIEAERGFPCDVADSAHCQLAAAGGCGKTIRVAGGIPRNHLAVLGQVLHAAKLKPVSFSLGITALQPPVPVGGNGVLALLIGESHVALEVTVGGGVVTLRALDGALEIEGSRRELRADLVAREARITLGQLPVEIRQQLHTIRVFGPREFTQQLVDELELRLDSMALKAEAVTRYKPEEFGVQVPHDIAVSPAFSLAAERLTGRAVAFEFLPPRVTAWQQMAARYSSGKSRSVLATAGAVALVVGSLFFYQQCQLWRLNSQWSKAAPEVQRLETIQTQISQYRPWFDESVRGLTILRALTGAFPEDGAVTAKTVEIRDLHSVTCTGTARSYQDLLKTLQRVRDIPQVREAGSGPTRGQAPALQFSFSFVWNEGGSSAN